MTRIAFSIVASTISRMPLRELLDGANSDRSLRTARCMYSRARTLIQPKIAAQQSLAPEPAQNQVRVGHRRRFAAPVADRARIGPRALRPHAKRARAIESRDRSAARAHRVNLEHRHRHRQARDRRLIGRAESR